MPPCSNNTYNSQNNRHSHAHGQGGSADMPGTHIHLNEAAEICFQLPQGAFRLLRLLRNRTDQTLIVVATLNAQCEPQAVQSLSVSEVPMPCQGKTPFYVYHWCAHAFQSVFTAPTPDSPSNPFISTDNLPPDEGFLHHPHPPTSMQCWQNQWISTWSPHYHKNMGNHAHTWAW